MVAGKQSVRLTKCVSANQEIRRHPAPGTPVSPVLSPGDACLESGLGLNRAELDFQLRDGLAADGNRREAASDLRPHHVANEQSAFRGAGTEGIARCHPKLRIVVQKIEQHIGISRSRHLSGYSPRSSFMMSSVRRPNFKMPKYLSNGSRDARLLMTNRPRSSRTSRTWPVRMPSRTRRGLGMVICPFSDTVVFIPLWYEFLLELSNLKVSAQS